MKLLKILITYYTQSGNTKKLAESIFEGCLNEDAELKPINEIDPHSLKNNDLVFLGSGIYASRVHKSLGELINQAQELPPNFAFFCSHASLNSYQDGFKVVKRKLGKTDSKIIDIFDCCGDNIGLPEATRKAMLENLPHEKREEAEAHQQWLKGRPNAEDLENAKKFAQSIVNKI